MDLTDLVWIDAAGFHCADFPTFLFYFQTQYQNTYGSDVDLDASTQDGQWVTIQAQAAYDSAQVSQSSYNSFSPVTAQGVGLSRVVKINGVSREIASNSSVDLVIVGQNGTVITNGIAIDILQQQWLIPTTTIPSGGTITVTAIAQNVGAVSADANTVTGIFTPTLGWQTVNNPAAATLGAPVETDAQLRVRQQQSTADPSLAVFDGTIGGVENLTGVQKVGPYENDGDTTDANGLPPHSICLVVKGGSDSDIWNEIALHKTPGTNTYGSTSGTVYDSHGMPLVINFQRQVTATVQVQITIVPGIGWSSDFKQLITTAVANYINANAIGATVLITQLYPVAYLVGTSPGLTYDISGIEIGENGGALGTSNISLLFDEEAVTSSVIGVDITFVGV